MAVSDQAGSEAGAKPLHGAYWEMPDLYGQVEALNSMGTIAAPLLAGFSLVAMVQTLTINTSQARWPTVAVPLFMLAAVLFVTTVQAMFWARMYQASPKEIMDWWPDADAAHPERLKLLQEEQKVHAAGFRVWSDRARATYSVALLCLLAALTVLAVPAESHGQGPVWRWLAVAVGGVAFIAEVIWITGSFTNIKWLARLLQPQLQLGDTSDNSSSERES
jgi:hypothetical protein